MAAKYTTTGLEINRMLGWVLILVLGIMPQMTRAQSSDLIAYYPFDDGSATDVPTGNSNGILSDIAPTVGCGVVGNALQFDGENNFVDLLGIVSTGDYFRELGEFTISFYFQTESPFGTHDILSKRNSCSPDNAFAVRYTPSSQTISVEISESNERNARFIHRLTQPTCWIHVAITKSTSSQALYINGSFVSDANISGNLDMTSTANFKIADSPCLGTTDRRFAGLLDELRIYNRALRDDEIRALYIPVDQILTPDTTVYQGDAIALRAGQSCAPALNWVPGGSDPMGFSTTITPPQTATYALEFLYPSCTATDSVLVNVIDPSQVDCGEVPMANAFTPNGDGRNDAFFISNPFSIQDLIRFEIFDKWGNKVFGTTQVADVWDGSYQGRMVNPGLFVYKIRYSCAGEEFTKSGSVMVLR
ncbi:MAG: gliding motility-associated C-terminal domain-containing protein [Saprospiraceae bacterium]|nr:gliding motility-associated C-terminal domain-containing protein [Saprospiraceae bacterium]